MIVSQEQVGDVVFILREPLDVILTLCIQHSFGVFPCYLELACHFLFVISVFIEFCLVHTSVFGRAFYHEQHAWKLWEVAFNRFDPQPNDAYDEYQEVQNCAELIMGQDSPMPCLAIVFLTSGVSWESVWLATMGETPVSQKNHAEYGVSFFEKLHVQRHIFSYPINNGKSPLAPWSVFEVA